jgi:hypothetical protein
MNPLGSELGGELMSAWALVRYIAIGAEEFGHGYKLSEIKEALNILSGTMLEISLAEEQATLLCNVQDRVGLNRILLERLDRFCRRQYDQFDFSAIGFVFHLVHGSARLRYPYRQPSRRHFQGISSSIESGVCPKTGRSSLGLPQCARQ